MSETIIVRGDGISVDLLLWRKYGVRGRALVEATLSANPGLPRLGRILPHGTAVVLPDLPQETSAPRRLVTLFPPVVR